MSEIERMMLSTAFGGTMGLIIGQTLIVISNWIEKGKVKNLGEKNDENI